MAHFYRFETKNLVLSIRGGDGLAGYEHIIVSFQQLLSGARLDFFEDQLDISTEENTIGVHLSQDDTSLFQVGPVKVQVNIYYNSTERDVTVQGEIEVYDNIYRKVIT